jgi:hypothetical protein
MAFNHLYLNNFVGRSRQHHHQALSRWLVRRVEATPGELKNTVPGVEFGAEGFPNALDIVFGAFWFCNQLMPLIS